MKAIKTNLSELVAKAEKAFKVGQGVKRAADEQQKMAEASKTSPKPTQSAKGK